LRGRRVGHGFRVRGRRRGRRRRCVRGRRGGCVGGRLGLEGLDSALQRLDLQALLALRFLELLAQLLQLLLQLFDRAVLAWILSRNWQPTQPQRQPQSKCVRQSHNHVE